MYPHCTIQKILSIFIAFLAVMLPLAPVRQAAAQIPMRHSSALAEDPQPVLLKDIYTADASSDPMYFFDFGDIYFYSAEDSNYGRELWASDGTAAGTRLVKDIVAGSGSSYPEKFTRFRDKVFFVANSGIWYTDGTSEGTANVFTTSWDFGYGSVDALIPIGDWLYFICGWDLVRYSGLGDDWERVLTSDFELSSTHTAVMNGALYFSATDGASGYEPWRYDLTTKAVSLVKDLCPGTCKDDTFASPGSYPDYFTVIGNTVYFTAIDASHGRELWASDGSAAGTVLVKDLRAGAESSVDYDIEPTPANGWLYFIADDGLHGQELWRSDGTEANTTLIEVAPGAASTDPQYLTLLGNGGNTTVVFSARDGLGHGKELWSLPVVPAGSTASPSLIETAPGTIGGNPEFLTVLGEAVYFAAQDTPGNIELWKTGGTQASTTRVADLTPGPDGSAPQNLAAWNGSLVFSAIDAVNGREPWISDGTSEGTSILKNMASAVDSEGSDPSVGLITNVGGSNIRYFHARDPLHGVELWRTNGTEQGTWLVKDIYPGPGPDYYYCNSPMAEMNGNLYFCAWDPENGVALWRSDGTTAGTWMVKAMAPGGSADLYNIIAAGNLLFFDAYDPEHGNALWASDGTETGTYLVKEIEPGSSQIWKMANLDDQLIFTINTERYGGTLQFWRSDGTTNGTQMFAGPYTSYFNSDDLFETAQDGKTIYFSMCEDPESVIHLWSTDGTTAGTEMISSNGPSEYRDPYGLYWMAGQLYFVAQADLSGEYYNEVSLWTLPADSSSADLVTTWPGSNNNPRFFGALNSHTLILLVQNDYYNEDNWRMIDISTGQQRSLPYGSHPSSISNPVAWAGKIYFIAEDSSDLPDGLWVTDGTEAGTKHIQDPATGFLVSVSDSFLSTSNSLYFTAQDSAHGSEPWIISSGINGQTYLPMIWR